jgi:hypothetical protein
MPKHVRNIGDYGQQITERKRKKKELIHQRILEENQRRFQEVSRSSIQGDSKEILDPVQLEKMERHRQIDREKKKENREAGKKSNGPVAQFFTPISYRVISILQYYYVQPDS